MLQFIIGTAGTGKTTYLTKEIAKVIDGGEKAILLVPEQFSFESERRLYRELGPKSSMYVEVLSFTRLCNSVFREFGGLAGVPVTKTSRYLLMSVAVHELQDQLQIYRKSAQNTSFLETLLTACSEFKTAGITPKDLDTFVQELPNDNLRGKMNDLSLVYTAYQTLLEKGYSDPEDDLIRCNSLLENNNYFQNFHVFVDGFTTFMAGEFEFLSHVIGQSPLVQIALTTNEKEDRQKGVGVFSVVSGTASRLERMAKDSGVFVEEPIYLEEPLRYKNKELILLSKNFMQPIGDVYEDITEHIQIYEGKTPYSEVEFIASTIRKLVREEKMRYKEIAVIGRNPDSYKRLTQLLFDEYQIPYFSDETMDVENSPLIFGVQSALSAVQNNFDSESMLSLAKSPLMGLRVEEVATLENYCYSWQVRGHLWQTDFVNNPRGMVDAFTDSDSLLLKGINETRKKLIDPLNKLKESMKSGKGNDFSYGIFKFIEEIGGANNLKIYSGQLPDQTREEFLSLNAQLWDGLMDILDVFGEVLGTIYLGDKRLIELFRLAISSTEIGIIPQMLDQVLVGGADRIRPAQMRVVFVLGANEGVFPATVGNTGVFSDIERQTLVQSGLELSGAGLQQSLLEKFYGYFVCTLPSEKLYVSWHRANLKGQSALPSVLVTGLERVIPNHTKVKMELKDYIETEKSALHRLSMEIREDTTLRATLWRLLETEQSTTLERMKNAAWKAPHQLFDAEITGRMFGDSMRLSPSRVERFYRCPFAYFVQDGLRLKQRQKVEFSPLESGSLIHHVLQVMMQKYGGKGLADRTIEELETEVSEIILDYLSTRVEDKTQLPTRIHFLYRRLCGTLARLLEHLGKEFLQSLYTPIAYELPISAEGVPPLELKTLDGIAVTVEGVVDRVDVMEKDGKKYIRVVDYKSGSKDFKLEDILEGLNLQMLLYLFTIQEHGTEKLGGAIPAGILYMPVKESYSSLDRNTGEGQAKKELEKQWVMNGLLLDDEDVLRGMEEELGGLFIPAKLKKNGELDVRSSLANAEELAKLSTEVKKQIVQMASALRKGKIEAFPVNDTDYPTCSYCDYRSVCGYEEGDPIRKIDKMSRREVLDLLGEREDKDGD